MHRNVIPVTDNTLTLGESLQRWNHLYATNVTATNVNATTGTIGNIYNKTEVNSLLGNYYQKGVPIESTTSSLYASGWNKNLLMGANHSNLLEIDNISAIGLHGNGEIHFLQNGRTTPATGYRTTSWAQTISMWMSSTGNVTINSLAQPPCRLNVKSNLLLEGTTFYVGGNRNTFYPVVFESYPSWQWSGPYRLCIERGSVHSDGLWLGALTFVAEGHSTQWGNQADFNRTYYANSPNGATYTRLVANFIQDYSTAQLVVYLRGGLTYGWSGEGIVPVFLNPNGTSYTIQGGANVTYNTTTTINPSYDRDKGYNDSILGIDAAHFPARTHLADILFANQFTPIYTFYYQKISDMTTLWIPNIAPAVFNIAPLFGAIYIALPINPNQGGQTGTCFVSVNGGAYYLTMWSIEYNAPLGATVLIIFADINRGQFVNGSNATVRSFTLTYY
jgi:hypothetical protein